MEQSLSVSTMPSPGRPGSYQERNNSTRKAEKSSRPSISAKQPFVIFIDALLEHKVVLLFLNYLCHLVSSVDYFTPSLSSNMTLPNEPEYMGWVVENRLGKFL